MYNLTEAQKQLVIWLVENVRSGNLNEEFEILWSNHLGSKDEAFIIGFSASIERPPISRGSLDVLESNELLRCEKKISFRKSGSSYENTRICVLLGKAYEAVDSGFESPDISFLKHITPLADITTLDEEIKTRCLPILGAGAVDSRLWDSAVRTAGVILEGRLRDVGSVSDPSCIGQALVNTVFGPNGNLASKFQVPAERQGYRDLYAGVVGTFRNPSAHRLVDPSPEEGGAFIIFVNLLLKKLEALRADF